MSLPNPNSFVTEERLNEYHNTILPFLGGMPDILANKFSRADLYSTDEKMIGRWTDGKPLYQKVLKSKALTTANWTWQNIFEDADFCNAVEKMVDCRFYTSDAFQYDGIYRINAGAIQMYTYGNGDTVPANKDIIIQYTKTTDSPVEIGIDTDYSTTEKIVGTWIDGKPIYQKTYELSTSAEISSTSWTAVGVSSDGIGIVINAYGSGRAVEEDGRFGHLNAAKISGEVKFLVCCDNNSIEIHYITIQYTKTTD